jgi:hypothetical protein
MSKSTKELIDIGLGEPVWSLIQRGLHSLDRYEGTFAGRPGPKTIASLEAYLQSFPSGEPDEDRPAPATPAPTSTRPFGELLAEIALKEVGVRERGGNNRGEDIVKYQRATWLAPGAWAWCGALVGWCIQQAIEQGGPVRFTRPRTAGAWDYENWALDKDQRTGQYRHRSGGQKAGVRLIKPLGRESVKPGDIIVFTYSHIGIIVNEGPTNGSVITVEGNTGGQGAQREGDGVYQKTQPVKSIRSIIRLTR